MSQDTSTYYPLRDSSTNYISPQDLTAVPLDDELLYAVSNIEHVQKHNVIVDKSDNSACKHGEWKHLRLLDGLALLLVRCPTGDVVATSFIQKNDAITFIYAKNEAIVVTDKAYVDHIEAQLASLGPEPTDRDTTTYAILCIALRHCSAKFDHRCKKIALALKEEQLIAKIASALDGRERIWEGPWNAKSDLVDGLHRAGLTDIGNDDAEDDGACVVALLICLAFLNKEDENSGSTPLSQSISWVRNSPSSCTAKD